MVGLGTVAALGIAVVWGEWRHHRLRTRARYIAIDLPPEVSGASAVMLWTNLVGLLRPAWARFLLGQPHLAFEIAASPTGTTIGLWVSGGVPPGLVERAIEAAWPGAETRSVDAEPPLPLTRWATGGVLRMATPEHYPLKSDHELDPMRAVLGAMAGLYDGEAAAVQVLARPVTGRRLARSRRAAAERRSGMGQSLALSVLDFVTPGGQPAKVPAAGDDPVRPRDVRHILDKLANPSWEMSIRYGVTASDDSHVARQRARGHAHAIASAFSVFTGRNSLRRHRLPRPAAVLSGRSFARGCLVSVPELAAVAHLPVDAAIPGISRAGARSVAPPSEIGNEIPNDAKVLGDAVTGGRRRAVSLTPVDSRYHVHVMGSTGSGKSTLLTNLILGDVEAGRGAVVIDPKGDLVVDILDRLPNGVEDRTVLIDPDQNDAVPGLNVLQAADIELAVDNVVGIFHRIFESFWGPRTDDILRAACLTLRRSGEATLADIPQVLADRDHPSRLRARDDDPAGLGGFWEWYDALGPSQQANVVGPVISKLRAFLMRDFTRRVVGEAQRGFDMAAVLDGGLCLVRIPKGIVGSDTSRLLGSFVVAKVWQAITERARLGQESRLTASLYIDECQNFLTLPRALDEMLAEARGYGLSLVLAHQHLTQLPRDLRDAVSANARNKVFFTMSPEDAHILQRHVAPNLSEHDLSHLGGYQAATRLVVNGRDAPAFTMVTRAGRPLVPGRAAAVRTALAAAVNSTSDPGAADRRHIREGGPALAAPGR